MELKSIKIEAVCPDCKHIRELELREKTYWERDNFKIPDSLKGVMVKDAKLSRRCKNGLINAGFMFMGDLETTSSRNLMRVRQFGSTSHDEVINLIREYKIENPS